MCLGIHTGERNFGCEICGQRFRAKGTLKGHILTHTGERPFSKYIIETHSPKCILINCQNNFILIRLRIL